MFHDFDGCSRGYGHARHIGRVVAGAVMQVYDKVCYTDVNDMDCVYEEIKVPSNMPTAEELKLAKKYVELHHAGKDEHIPYKGMMLTTVVAEASRKIRLEHVPDTFPMSISAIKVGNVALFGVPGEPFTGIGLGLKEASGWDVVLPCCNTNAYDGYFPMRDSYEEGGYEARSSNYKAGVAELLIQEGVKLLDDLRK